MRKDYISIIDDAEWLNKKIHIVSETDYNKFFNQNSLWQVTQCRTLFNSDLEWIYKDAFNIIFITPQNYLLLCKYVSKNIRKLPNFLPDTQDEELLIVNYKQKQNRLIFCKKQIHKQYLKSQQTEQENYEAIRTKDLTPYGKFEYINPKNPAYKKKRSFFS